MLLTNHKKLANNDIDLTKQSIEVAPIAHYHMGGIEVDERMETCIKGLLPQENALAPMVPIDYQAMQFPKHLCLAI